MLLNSQDPVTSQGSTKIHYYRLIKILLERGSFRPQFWKEPPAGRFSAEESKGYVLSFAGLRGKEIHLTGDLDYSFANPLGTILLIPAQNEPTINP